MFKVTMSKKTAGSTLLQSVDQPTPDRYFMLLALTAHRPPPPPTDVWDLFYMARVLL